VVNIANPFTDYPTTTIINTEQANLVTFEMIDLTGRLVFEKSQQLSEGSNTFAFEELGYLKQGIYLMKISINGAEPIVKKIIKTAGN
jgi:hypothetical protein